MIKSFKCRETKLFWNGLKAKGFPADIQNGALRKLLASKATEIFDRSQTDEKRQLIGYVFANLELKGATLCYSLKKPFNLLVDLASCKEWLPEQDSNLRPID